MTLTVADLAKMIDMSAVRADTTELEIQNMCAKAKEYKVGCAMVLPTYVTMVDSLLADTPEIKVGTVVGFPSGGHVTETKVAETQHLIESGAREIDMMINLGMLLSGEYEYCEADIRGVVDAAGKVPVKVILETHYLGPSQIERAAHLAVDAGAAFVKTSTGWAETGATTDVVALIKSAVGKSVQIKASGGINDLDAVISLYNAGARRFGINAKKSVHILQELAERPGGAVEV